MYNICIIYVFNNNCGSYDNYNILVTSNNRLNIMIQKKETNPLLLYYYKNQIYF